ncbi:MAG: hypothetical protein M3245_06860 [Actinomycetota bacterium]|nr:hypothetical protein [Actinomycetota bacterium]
MDVPEGVSIPCCSYSFNGSGLDIEGFEFWAAESPAYVGFALERLPEGDLVVGALDVVAMGLDVIPALVQLSETNDEIPPGLYRLHLFSDVQVELRVEARGLSGDIVVDRWEPEPLWSRIVELTPTAADARVSLETRQTVEVSPTSLVVQITRLQAEVVLYDRVQHCIRRNNDPCQFVHHSDSDSAVHAVSGKSGVLLMTTYTRDRFGSRPPSGRSEAVFTAQAAAASVAADGFVLVLNLPD